MGRFAEGQFKTGKGLSNVAITLFDVVVMRNLYCCELHLVMTKILSKKFVPVKQMTYGTYVTCAYSIKQLNQQIAHCHPVIHPARSEHLEPIPLTFT